MVRSAFEWDVPLVLDLKRNDGECSVLEVHSPMMKCTYSNWHVWHIVHMYKICHIHISAPLACLFCRSFCKSGWCCCSVWHSHAKQYAYTLIWQKYKVKEVGKTWIPLFQCALQYCFIAEPHSFSMCSFFYHSFFVQQSDLGCHLPVCLSVSRVYLPWGTMYVLDNQVFISLSH